MRQGLRAWLSLVGRVRWHAESFYTLTWIGDAAATGAPSDYVRWIDRADVAGVVRLGLFTHPVASRRFAARVPPGGRVRASIALLPDVWEKNRGGVLFSISVTATDATLRADGQWVLNPREHARDRCWRTVELDLSAMAGHDVEIRLGAELPPTASPEYAWAVWGDPELLGRKPLRSILQRQLRSLREHGIRGTLRRYRTLLAVAQQPTNRYVTWLRRHGYEDVDVARLKELAAGFAHRPTISLITPVYNTDPEWLHACVASVRNQSYPRWELCLCDDASSVPATRQALDALENTDPRIKIARLPEHRGISAASNAALALATGEFIGLLDHDDELTPDALHEVVRCLSAHPGADLVYSDEDKLELDGTPTEPFFKPDWSPEYLRSTMYIGHLAVHRRSLVTAVGGFRSEFDGSQDYDLALRVTERTSHVVHIPRILYRWRKVAASAAGSTDSKSWAYAASFRALADHVARLGLAADVEARPGNGLWRIRHRILDEPLVSIVIPTDGRVVPTTSGPKDLLLDCVRSVVERTAYKRYELLVVDNGRLSPAAQTYLARIEHRRVSFSYAGPFNFSVKANFSARHARGDHLLLLNDDIEVIGEEWLAAMLEFSQQREIGAVGAKLYYPDGRLQHVGVVLGIGGGACHVFSGQPRDHPGYFGSTLVVRNYSAVTGACVMTRRAVFDEVGGFDERFATDFNDVDYCLRVGARGYRVVFTPFAELRHHEGATFGSRERIVNPREIQALGERWSEQIANDPSYNPNLTRTSLDYGLRI